LQVRPEHLVPSLLLQSVEGLLREKMSKQAIWLYPCRNSCILAQ
jgi:hypothetical protein